MSAIGQERTLQLARKTSQFAKGANPWRQVVVGRLVPSIEPNTAQAGASSSDGVRFVLVSYVKRVLWSLTGQGARSVKDIWTWLRTTAVFRNGNAVKPFE